MPNLQTNSSEKLYSLAFYPLEFPTEKKNLSAFLVCSSALQCRAVSFQVTQLAFLREKSWVIPSMHPRKFFW